MFHSFFVQFVSGRFKIIYIARVCLQISHGSSRNGLRMRTRQRIRERSITVTIYFCCAFYSLRKLQLSVGNVSQNTTYNAAQNTNFPKHCCAKYRILCCAKYKLSLKLLRKIQKMMLRLDCANYRCCANYNKPPQPSIL